MTKVLKLWPYKMKFYKSHETFYVNIGLFSQYQMYVHVCMKTIIGKFEQHLIKR
jgi:hypothetical protein